MTRIHAFVVHREGPALLERCLRSLLASVGVDLRIVVVVNGGSEPPPALAGASDRVFHVATGAELGFAAANNLGVAWAESRLGRPDYCFFVNDDAAVARDALARMVAGLRAHPAAALAGPTLLILGAPDHLNSLGLNVTEDGWGWDEGIGQRRETYGPLPDTRPVLAVTGAALLVEAGVLAEVGGWTEVYGYYMEDIDLALKVWKRGRQVLHVADAVAQHQVSATMTDGSRRKRFYFLRNRLVLALLHWPPGLLWKTFRIALGECLDLRRIDQPLPGRALLAVLRRLPGLWRRRLRGRGDDTWRRFLRPARSVPVIRLPEVSMPVSPEPPDDASFELSALG